MIFETYKPTGILRNHIENYLVVKTEQAISAAIIPETSPILSFRSKGRHSYWVNDIQKDLPSSAITGLRKWVKPIFLSKNTETILVKFKPCESALFFKEPLHHFSEVSISLYDFLPRQVVLGVEEQLTKDNNNLQKISTIENFLLSLFSNNRSNHLIKTAVQKIVLSNGTLKIKELASILNISLDAFEKQFRKIAGTSPKQFSSIVRLTSLINGKYNNQSFSGIAYDYGYFDQSHFIKDFKMFTGKTPLDYFKNTSDSINQ
jgi:AraC-like DNA-binding protein